MTKSTITVAIYTNRNQLDVEFPARWVICPCCDGEAKTSRGVECDGGGFTSSEWRELDDEFREDYLAGRYDRPCEHCDGRGRVQQINEEWVRGWRQKILLRAYHAQLKDDAEIDAIHAMERRMGA